MMNNQHQQLAEGGWQKLSLMEQLANIGSEVIRATRWKQKNNSEYARLAFYRSLELLSYSLADPKNIQKLRELARMHELLADYFEGSNTYNSNAKQLSKEFLSYTYAANITLRLAR